MISRVCVAFVLLLGLASRAGSPGVDVLVIAPHPDDEVIMAGGVMEEAVKAGKHVAVVIVTNGDATCARSGWVRQAESVAALATLGVREDDVHFLGYPDGALSRLGRTPLGPMDRATPSGGCEKAEGTYGNRGAGHRDEHSRRTGRPGPWTSTGLTGDLAAVLQALRPKEVYITHGIDEHPDHAATYVYFRRALDTLDFAPAIIHRAVVHASDDCWPGDCVRPPYEPDQPMPPLPPPHQAYAPAERVAIDPRRELGLLALHPSQTGPSPKDDWLAGFARRDEVFFPERYVRLGGRWRRPPSKRPLSVPLGSEVVLGEGALRFELTTTPERISLYQSSAAGQDRRLVARWHRNDAGPLRLEVDSRPEDGAVSEWSVWGRDGLIGLEVLTGVDVSRLAVVARAPALSAEPARPRAPPSGPARSTASSR